MLNDKEDIKKRLKGALDTDKEHCCTLASLLSGWLDIWSPQKSK